MRKIISMGVIVIALMTSAPALASPADPGGSSGQASYFCNAAHHLTIIWPDGSYTQTSLPC